MLQSEDKAYIKFCIQLGKTSSQIYGMITEAY
jgi:hypothetical protein